MAATGSCRRPDVGPQPLAGPCPAVSGSSSAFPPFLLRRGQGVSSAFTRSPGGWTAQLSVGHSMAVRGAPLNSDIRSFPRRHLCGAPRLFQAHSGHRDAGPGAFGDSQHPSPRGSCCLVGIGKGQRARPRLRTLGHHARDRRGRQESGPRAKASSLFSPPQGDVRGAGPPGPPQPCRPEQGFRSPGWGSRPLS